MKKILTYLTLILFFSVIYSCTRKELDIPKIYFQTASGYQVLSANLYKNTKCSVGVWCLQSENEKVKNRDFKVLKNVNNQPEVVAFSKTLADKEKEEYYYEFAHTCGDSIGEQIKYTYIITSDKGVENRISQTFTVVQ